MLVSEYQELQEQIDNFLVDREILKPVEELALRETEWLRHRYWGDNAMLSAKAELIQKKISDYELFGCQRGHVLDILSIYLDEPLRDRRNGVDPMGHNAMVIPLENRRGASYPIGVPVFLVSYDSGIRIDGQMGNHLDMAWRVIKPANPQEIREYFQSVPIAGFLGTLYHEVSRILGLQ